MTTLNPYLNWREGALEAMTFYQTVFGGDLTSSTFGEMGGMGIDESEHGKIMHSQLVAGGITLMGSDTPAHMGEPSNNGTISLSGSSDEEPELKGYWDKLSDGGSVMVPLEKAPWGDQFGMCTDKFGVDWMVNIAGSTQSRF